MTTPSEFAEAIVALRLAAAELNRAAWNLEHPGVTPVPQPGDLKVAQEALVDAIGAVSAVEESTWDVSYPMMVDGLSVDWEVLRMVVLSRLNHAIRDKVYTPVNHNDAGYSWLAEQWGCGNNMPRQFLQGDRTLGADLFVKVCVWTGYPIRHFIKGLDDDD